MSSSKELLNTPVGQRPAAPPASPHYDAARKGWNDRIEKAEDDKRKWRWAAFGLFGVCVLSVGGLVAAANQPPPKPLYIRVNSDGSGQVVGRAEQMNPVGTREARYYLQHWLKLTRTVPLDPVIIKSAWNEAYAFTTPQAANKLNAYARLPDSPMAKVGRETVAIQIRSVVPISATSYQARWTETTYTDAGQVRDTADWTATFTTKVAEPKDDKLAFVNPFGIYITDFNWQRDLANGQG